MDPIGDAFDALGRAMATAVGWAISMAMSLVLDTAFTPTLRGVGGAFNGEGNPYSKTMTVGLILMVIFLAGAVIQALVRGETSMAVRAIIFDMPVAILGMVFVLGVIQELVFVADELSGYFLGSQDDPSSAWNRIDAFLAWTASWSGETQGANFFIILLAGLIAFIAAIFLWFVMLIRMAIILLIAAFLPIVFAAMVWPAIRGSVKKAFELLLAAIFTKPAIALTLAVGAYAMGAVVGLPQGAGSMDLRVSPNGLLLYGNRTLMLSRDDGLTISGDIIADGANAIPVVGWFVGDDTDREQVGPCRAPGAAGGEVGIDCGFGFLTEASGANGEVGFNLSSIDGDAVVMEGTNIVRISGWGADGRETETLAVLGPPVDPAAGVGNLTIRPRDRETARLDGQGAGRTIRLDDAALELYLAAGDSNFTDDDEATAGIVELVDANFLPGTPPTVARGLLNKFGCSPNNIAASDRRFDPLFGGAADAGGPRSDRCLTTTGMGGATGATDAGVYVNDQGEVFADGALLGTLEPIDTTFSDMSLVAAGAALMLMASFAPFILLRLFPILELAVLAEAAGRPFSRAGGVALNVNSMKGLAGGSLAKLKGGGNVGSASGGRGGSSGGEYVKMSNGNQVFVPDQVRPEVPKWNGRRGLIGKAALVASGPIGWAAFAANKSSKRASARKAQAAYDQDVAPRIAARDSEARSRSAVYGGGGGGTSSPPAPTSSVGSSPYGPGTGGVKRPAPAAQAANQGRQAQPATSSR